MGINMSRYIILLTIMGVLMSSVLSVLVNLIFGINLPDYPFGDFLLYILIFIPPFVLLYVDGNSIKDNSGKVYGGFKRIASFLRCKGENVPVKKHYLWLFLILLFLSAMVLISSIPAPELPQWYADKMLRMVSPPYLPWSLLMVSIFAPLFEEIIFRKILMDEFLEKYKPIVAILLSAFLFGAIHFNVWQAIPAFLYGLLFGWIYFKFRNVIITIVLHSLNNTISIIIAYFMRDNIGLAFSPLGNLFSSDFIFYSIIFAAFALFSLSIYVIDKNLKIDVKS